MSRKRRRTYSGNSSRKHQKRVGHGPADLQSSNLDGSLSDNNNTNKAPDGSEETRLRKLTSHRKRVNSMDAEHEADFGKAEAKGRRRGHFAKLQHDEDENDRESRQSLRTNRSSKDLQESSDEEAHQANKRLDQRDPDFEPKGKASKDEDSVSAEAWKLSQPLDGVQQLENATETLRCTDLHMEKWHRDLRLPNKVEYALVEIGDAAADSTGESDFKKLQASTATEDYLQEFGWDFSTGGDREWNNPTPAEELYKNPIPLEGGNIPWDARPFVLVEGSNKIAERSDRLIKNGWKGAVMRLTSDNPSLFPQEWKAIKKANGPRPELPAAYKDALNKGPPGVVSTKEGKKKRRSASQRSNMADTPRKVTKDLPPQSSVPATTLSMVNQATNPVPSVGPTGHVGMLPFPTALVPTNQKLPFSNNLEPIQEHREASPSPFLINQHAKAPGEEGTDNVVDALIAQWNLSPVYHHALFLAKLIEEDQLRFDRNESKRKLCNLLCSLEDSRNPQQGLLPFKFIPMEEIEKLDREECRGNVALTENSPHIGDSAMEVTRRWIEFSGVSSEEWNNPVDKAELDHILGMVSKKVKRKIKSPAELAIERKAGGLFAGLFKFEDLVEVTNNYLRSPRHLRQAGIRPFPDCAIRPSGECWNFWPAALTPIVASFDAKQLTVVNNRQVAAQLALNILPTLIVSICMYLDTRKHATDPLPGWMFFYSWLYTDKGYIVYIHYPSAELTENATDWSWRFHSLQLTKKFDRVWNAQTSNAYLRMGASSAMLQIRSHTRFALGQIRAWAKSRAQYGGGGILDQVIARSYYEEKNTEWLFDQAAKLTGNGKRKIQSN